MNLIHNDTPWIDKQYLQLISHRIQKFTWKSATLINCRCFICGDSQRNTSKARGYFMFDRNHWTYYCHNCNCSHSFQYVLKNFFDDLYAEYIKDKLSKDPTKKDDIIPVSSQSTEQKFKEKKTQKLIPLWIPCHILESSHKAIQYLTERQIPEVWWEKMHYTDNFSVLVKHADTDLDERIVLTVKNQFKSVVGYIGRTITNHSKRYIVHIKEKSKHGYFNMDNIKCDELVKVVEGAFDSMFISNAIGVGNANLSKYDPVLLDHKNHVLIFDNEPRNKEVMVHIRKAIWTNRPVCIWNDKFTREKDINRMICSGKSSADIENFILENTFQGLEARLRFKTYCKI